MKKSLTNNLMNSMNLFPISSRRRRGFTLIELLIVISIIGVLSALLLSNMQDARARARDAQRKSDLKQTQKALEMYKQDNNTYPATSGWESALSPASGTKYMNEPPQDPLNSTPYVYTYTLDADPYKYTLVACLENASDPSADGTTDPSCTNASFTLTEP